MATPLDGPFASLSTFIGILLLVAFRLAFTAPGAAKCGTLPGSWSRWILGESGHKKQN